MSAPSRTPQPSAPFSDPATALPLIRLQNVTVRAGGRTLLDSVTLRIEEGEAVRLAGPNGGGKTSLLRLLAGELAPSAGKRRYGLTGQEQAHAVEARRTLSVVGPDAEAFYLTRDWDQTVRDVLLAAFEGDTLRLWTPTPEAVARLDEVAAQTELDALLERDVRTLSHGQRRRVMLARALMPRPRLLLLDEFTDGLSAEARRTLGHVLERVHAGGVAVVLATHRPEEAPPLPWRTLTVEGGQLRADDQHIPEVPATFSASALPRPPGEGELVRLRDVQVFRNGHLALGPLSWTWNSGQHWLVTGENGSGKSTLARLIAGELSAALGGTVERPYLTALGLRDLLSTRRRTLGLVSAEVGIRQRRDWTGLDVLHSAWDGTEGFAPQPMPTQQAQAHALAERLHLSELLPRSAETLSQGQLRRLLLARAVLPRPRLLLLDEGLDFVDAEHRAQFVALLPDLIESGTHLMVIAHRDADAPAGLTHELRLDGGRVAWSREL